MVHYKTIEEAKKQRRRGETIYFVSDVGYYIIPKKKENNYTSLKYFGLIIITLSLCEIFTYDIYTRNEFMGTLIMELIWGFILLGFYYYKNPITIN